MRFVSFLFLSLALWSFGTHSVVPLSALKGTAQTVKNPYVALGLGGVLLERTAVLYNIRFFVGS